MNSAAEKAAGHKHKEQPQMRVFIIKMLMKRCFANELQEISKHAEHLIFKRLKSKSN